MRSTRLVRAGLFPLTPTSGHQCGGSAVWATALAVHHSDRRRNRTPGELRSRKQQTVRPAMEKVPLASAARHAKAGRHPLARPRGRSDAVLGRGARAPPPPQRRVRCSGAILRLVSIASSSSCETDRAMSSAEPRAGKSPCFPPTVVVCTDSRPWWYGSYHALLAQPHAGAANTRKPRGMGF